MSMTPTCPYDGGELAPTGWTAEGNQTGRCRTCGEPVRVVVVPAYPLGAIDLDAPFYPLVELIDSLAGRHKESTG